jgi:hypothetical protein
MGTFRSTARPTFGSVCSGSSLISSFPVLKHSGVRGRGGRVATRHNKEGLGGVAPVGARNPRQGSMKTNRTITPVVGLCLALCLATPVAAQANPILSGYGGPGQGNQAILGSALLNGPAGGGGGSAGSGSSGENGSSTTATSVGSGGRGHRGASKQSSARGQSATSASSLERTAQARLDPASAYLAAERGHAVGQSGVLGLGGRDVLYIILVLGALMLAAVFTRRLTQTTAAGTQR